MWKHLEPWLPFLIPLFLAYVFWPFISAIITLAFRKRSPEEWETWALSKPGLALVVEMCKANGWNIGKNLQILQRYAQRRAGQLPDDIWGRLPVSPNLRKALADPQMRAALEAFTAGGVRGELTMLVAEVSAAPANPPAPPAPSP